MIDALKAAVKSALGAAGHAPRLAPLLARPAVRRVLQAIPGGKAFYASGWQRRHPFDRLNGTRTSGTVPAQDLDISAAARNEAVGYGGSQPGVLRAAMSALPALDGFTFVDLGCGKGRPLFVASEFQFKAIIGVELSPRLAAIAADNARIMRLRYPQRVPVQVVTGDASTYALPPGDLVVLLYNPFGRPLIRKVVHNVEHALTGPQRSVFVVYYNPVHGDCFDASRKLRRCFARTLPYAADELGFGPDGADTVVVWEPGHGAARPGTEARIVVTVPGVRCELAGQRA